MYLDFFGLDEAPFNNTPDVKYLYLSTKHQEALAHMLYGINEKKGFITITGEIGAGKTTLCRALLNELTANTKVAIIFNSYISELELLKTINQELFLDYASDSKKDLIDELNQFLLQQHSVGGNVVLIIDEAQNLSVQVLEQIRMLSNLETENEKLLQIVLVGQPELKDVLSQDELVQLNQRINVRYHLAPLSQDEMQHYLFHRLKVAGLSKSIEFSENALSKIFDFSSGVPRMINNVADRSLLVAFSKNVNSISSDFVDQACSELTFKKDENRSTNTSGTKTNYILYLFVIIFIGALCTVLYQKIGTLEAPALTETDHYVQVTQKADSEVNSLPDASIVKTDLPDAELNPNPLSAGKSSDSEKKPDVEESVPADPMADLNNIVIFQPEYKKNVPLKDVQTLSLNNKSLYHLGSMLNVKLELKKKTNLERLLIGQGYNILRRKNVEKILSRLNYPFISYIRYDDDNPHLPVIMLAYGEKMVFYNLQLDIEEKLNKKTFLSIYKQESLVIYKNYVDLLKIDLKKNSKDIYRLKKVLIGLSLYNGDLNSFADQELSEVLDQICQHFQLEVKDPVERKSQLDLLLNILIYKKELMG